MSLSSINNELLDNCSSIIDEAIGNHNYQKNETNLATFLNYNSTIDDYFIILFYLIRFDLKKAKELLDNIFNFQKLSGEIPSKIDASNTAEYKRAPKPLLAYICKLILLELNDLNFAKKIIPKLRLYILWIMTYYDPQNKKEYRWINIDESIVKKNPNSLTPDLYALLISEIESVKEIEEFFDERSNENWISNIYLEKLKNDLDSLFINKETNLYSNIISNNKEKESSIYYNIIPLINNYISSEIKENTLYMLSEKYKKIDVDKWTNIYIKLDKDLVFRRILFIEILGKNNSNNVVIYDYLKFLIYGLNKWYQKNKEKINDNLTLSYAAYILLINNQFSLRYRSKNIKINKFINLIKFYKIDRLDIAIVIFFITTYFGIIYWNNQVKTPPPIPVLEAEILNSYMYYDINNFQKNYNIIEKYYPDRIDNYKLLLVNLLILNDMYIDSELHIKELRIANPDSPGIMILNALLLHNQESYNEANEVYDEFCYLFSEIFPNIIEEINIYKFLSYEKLLLPKDWKKIFKYRILHEL